MRLAVLTDRPHSNYGAELNLLGLGRMAQDLGHDVVATSIEPGVFVDSAAHQGLETLVIPTPDTLSEMWAGGLRPRPNTLVGMARFGQQIHGILRERSIDVVIASSVRAAAMLWPGRLRRPHLLWYIQMLTDPSPRSTAAALAARQLATIAPGVENSVSLPLRFGRRVLDLPPCREADAFGVAHRDPHRAGVLEVVTVSKVTPRKGIHTLVEAAAAARSEGTDVRVTVVGAPSGSSDEDYAARIRDRAAAGDVPMHWAGWHDDVAPFLAAADAFALVSDREGLPGAVIEAMAAGLPIVVTDTGPAARLIETTESGLVVPTADVAAVAVALRTLADDPDRADRMGEKAAEAAVRFSPEETRTAISAILNGMAPRSSRHGGARP